MANNTMTEVLTKEALQESIRALQENTDAFFLIAMGTICFFMQCGFAFLEAGAVRSKNTTNILIKNMLDIFIGGIAYWLVGYALAFGSGNKFCGTTHFALFGVPDDELAFWFFQFVFAATTATIVSGSMAERCAFMAYLIYSFVLTAVVYPIVSHWAWSPDGWLHADSGSSYQDYAGAGIVHLTGGVAALTGAVILGPRHDRFAENGSGVRGHSIPLAALGGFILLFGFLAFNGGSQSSISQPGDAGAVAHAIVVTVVAGSCGGVNVLLVYRAGVCGRPSTWSFLMALNGALTGMVSICSGANILPLWAACVTGIVGGWLFLAVHFLLSKLKVDDPLDAVAVHLAGGIWSLVSVALFQEGGILEGGSLEVLKWNLAGAAAIIAWTGGVCVLMFGSLRLLGWLRVPLEMEIQGMDILKHGEPAYPAESWQEQQYHNHDHDAHKNIRSNHSRNHFLPPNMSAPVPQSVSWSSQHQATSSSYYYPHSGYWTQPDSSSSTTTTLTTHPDPHPYTLPRPNSKSGSTETM